MMRRLLVVFALLMCVLFIAGPAAAESLPPAVCPAYDLSGCNANDVTSNISAVEVLSPNNMCEPDGTINLNITVIFSLDGGATRYDLGVYVANDGKSLINNSSVTCSGNYGPIPPFIDLDGGGDLCGDLNGATAWTFNTTVPCKAGGGDLMISSCRFWKQPGNNTLCISLADTRPGTGAKCDCTPLTITPDLSFCATTDCDDGIACTVDSCDDTARACVHMPDNTACDDGQFCTEDICTAGAGCSNPPKTDGSTCDDNNLCTQTDSCQSGTCTGSNPVTCPALDQCHDPGVCDTITGICSNPPKTDGSTCDDNNLCTQTDTCQSGTCTGSNPVTCPALDQCHDPGVCDTITGICSNPPKTDGSTCNDGNSCTTGDTCSAGICVAGPAPDCDDGNICTTDSCNPATGCVHTNNADACSDGNVCNGVETCSAGICVAGPAPDCDDGNVCTTDSCDTTLGCQHVNNANPCDDGNVCTMGDTCSSGVCTGGGGLTCDDYNPCTTDSCDTTLGCRHVNNTDPCDDRKACTTVDICALGICIGGPDPYCDDSAYTDDGGSGAGAAVTEPVPEVTPEPGPTTNPDNPPVDKNGGVDTSGIVLTDDILPYDGTIGADSPLYGLKLSQEDLDISFTPDEVERLDTLMSQAGLRLSEVRRSLDLNQDVFAEQALSNYLMKLDLINATIAMWDSDVTGLLPAEQMIIKYQFVLQNLLANHPDNTDLKRAYDASVALEEMFVEKTGVRYQRTIDNNRIILKAIGLEQDNLTG